MLSQLLQKLLFVNQFSIIDGKVEVLGSRYVMLNASDILALQEIDKTRMYKLMKSSSKGNIKAIIEHAKVYEGIKDESIKNIAELSRKVGKNKEGVVRTLQSLFELYGLGKMEITDLNNKDHRATIIVGSSSVAIEQLKKSKSKAAMCAVTAGILAGIFSYVFNEDVDCFEKKCLAKGDEFCLFIVGGKR